MSGKRPKSTDTSIDSRMTRLRSNSCSVLPANEAKRQRNTNQADSDTLTELPASSTATASSRSVEQPSHSSGLNLCRQNI